MGGGIVAEPLSGSQSYNRVIALRWNAQITGHLTVQTHHRLMEFPI